MREFIDALIANLETEALLLEPAECLAYSYDNSRHRGYPIAVVLAKNTVQIQTIIKLCNRYNVPLTTRGRGTGTPGGAVPLHGGVVLSCERMQTIFALDVANRTIIVEPGVLNRSVQQAAAQHGLFWAPDPSSAAFCTVGGNLAYNAAGPRALKYGTCRENTLALTAVTGTGEIIHTGSATTKGSVGYDLTRLLIGSEGTLAIITQATLKLLPLASSRQTLRAIYKTMTAATAAVVTIMAGEVTPYALEFMDATALALIRTQGISLPSNAGALLLIELDGSADVLTSSTAQIKKAAAHADLLEICTATTDIEAQQLWAARKALSPALRILASGKINEDVVVPVANIPRLIMALNELSEQYQLKIVNFGHAGNGNIHVNLLVDFNNSEQCQRAQQCLNALFDLVISLNGTLSGEHGIGIEKRDFLSRAVDPPTLAIMRQIKTVFDPLTILNPDKIFPAQ